MSTPDLAARHCAHATQGLDPQAVQALLAQVPGWAIVDGKLTRSFGVADYHACIALVNALAAMIHEQDHHPDMLVGYKTCTVSWHTHSVGGLSDNDFICAAKANAIYAQQVSA